MIILIIRVLFLFVLINMKTDKQETLQLIKIKGRDNVPVKWKAQRKYPQFTADDLPRNYYIANIIGSRGSGKTEIMIKLGAMMEKSELKDEDGNTVPMRFILFSPTVGTNEKFHSLKNLADEDIYSEYTEDKLNDILQECKEINQDCKEYTIIKKIFNKYIKNPKALFSNNEKFILEMYDYELPDPPTYPYGLCTNIIFDDLIGTEAFSTKRGI
jgi:hypothetical protein